VKNDSRKHERIDVDRKSALLLFQYLHTLRQLASPAGVSL